jgi:hypothetical protein
MHKLLQLFPLLFFFACSSNNNYTLIKDNLYSDNKGNLYLKSSTNENFDGGENIEVWLKEVYCDTCGTLTQDGWKNLKELKDVVDTNTWHFDTSNGYWTEYTDRNYRYHHTHMADGGQIELKKK